MEGSLVNVVKKNLFRDSLQLMRLSEAAKSLPGVLDAAIVMCTPTNKELLNDIGLLGPEGSAASPSDMVVALRVSSEADRKRVLDSVAQLLDAPVRSVEKSYASIEEAMRALPGANLALVSVPGEFARNVTMELLDRGLNVHLFSDHVSLQEEAEIKRRAAEKGLLVLGPGAGTSLISGRAVAFANRVTRGRLGVVAAAGTGLQELSVLVSLAGGGVSHGLGVGGGDVKREVGGLMSKMCLAALEADDGTGVLCFVSKPPSQDVADELVEHIRKKTTKPCVVCFVGGKQNTNALQQGGSVHFAETLHSAASECSYLLGGKRQIGTPFEKLKTLWESEAKRLSNGQKYVRGLYTGGTLMYEALVIISELLGGVRSNSPIEESMTLADYKKSEGHTLLDMGEEEFTSGRPHPMIDPTLRRLRFAEEAADPEVACIMLDFVLGYGSHADPVGAMAPAIEEASHRASLEGRYLPILAHVCGTEQDPQVLSSQEDKLKGLGVSVFKTNAEMAFCAALIAKRGLVGRGLEDAAERFLKGDI